MTKRKQPKPKWWAIEFPVGKRTIKITYECGDPHLRYKWTPDQPRVGELTDQEWQQYRTGRDELLRRVGEELQPKSMTVVEVVRAPEQLEQLPEDKKLH